MKKSLLVTLGLAGLVVICLAFTNEEPRLVKDDPGFKNLKILPKNITKVQLDSVMNHFTASLNVKCNFCHIRNEQTGVWDHASDENKHKLVARDMMKMTENINDKYFDVVGNKKDPLSVRLLVTCYTCHHGEKEPSVDPPAREGDNQRQVDSTRRN